MSVRAAAPALIAAILFGASTPLAKALTGSIPPLLLAGLLYLGSGFGLGLLLVLRRLAGKARGQAEHLATIPRHELPWLFGAILAGGVAGPAFLMTGLVATDAASASLLLNIEGVFTALIAWMVLKENADRKIVLGMVAIVAGGVLLSWQPAGAALSPGALLIAAACICWAVDNNLTRKVSANDAVLIVCFKGLVAGVCNTAFALIAGVKLPGAVLLVSAMVVGFAGNGLSLALFVVALRHLGTARTGAYFSVAPLFGVIISFALWPQMPNILFWLAFVLMALGVWLHLRERHEHTHEAQEHTHRHRHDEHHQHVHEFDWDGQEPHTHPHRHAPITHTHAHFPDIHHRHPHQKSQ
ncbi:DMT family transporter [Cupriavidus basilensis]|nr:DMT family transporter [Cupriavidus basilensis]